MTILKLREQHIVIDTEFCGQLREVLRAPEYSPLGIALAVDIRPTVPHYHLRFDEIYFVMEGDLTLQLHDPDTKRTWDQKLGENELCVITRGVHHGVKSASRRNRLCAICAPPFEPGDETRSNVLPAPKMV